MTAIAEWVIRVSLVFAAGSFVLNAVTAVRVRSVLFAVIAALSGVYVVGYLWLLTNPTQRIAWSEVMSGVALLAWPLVWLAPAARAYRRMCLFERAIETMAAGELPQSAQGTRSPLGI